MAEIWWTRLPDCMVIVPSPVWSSVCQCWCFVPVLRDSVGKQPWRSAISPTDEEGGWRGGGGGGGRDREGREKEMEV